MKIERMRTAFGRIAGIVVLAGALCTAMAQSGNKVSQFSTINLAAFGASAGNDCWGYVSPSGREYALVSLNNQVAFIEITDPANPVVLEQIPHTSSTWGDIKVWGHFAYAVTEAGGTGVQVIDMSDIDNGNVTLVRTISNPGRSHNVVLDTDNGFLYTVGSNQSLGTTMCFDLSNPSDPQRVGANSMTLNYMHDAQAMTWTTGNLAGRQLFFGCSEGRGVDIYDMTDKNSPVLVKRVTYPNMSYCHQAWVSEDRRFLFVDDELDEGNLLVPTRSLMFNIEDPENAYFVGTFSSGTFAIDHNQYVSDGFSFQANYRSGLRIFDVSQAPATPFEVGYYDTYPANDNRGFDGAWSCYPFFPSGTVIISDINRGFFAVNVTEATTRMKAPSIAELLNARVVSGGVGNTEAAEGSTFSLTHGTLTNVDRSVIDVAFEVQAYDTSPMGIKMMARAKGNVSGYRQDILLYDWAGTEWVVLNSSDLTPAFTNSLGTATGALSRFVHPGTKTVRGRLRYTPVAANTQKLVLEIDQVQFQITR